ncbi:nucleotide sugar dehydrogenase [Massiliimalia timonensis]|uniref:nucleotide sugar dehydrogenase n=1 Tax=Massiliimalia timonensis TaxID=1987501 RepID=UPI00189C62B8|nr:nucleotide sugar dehydrogenase [Massiliimalia timonensis]
MFDYQSLNEKVQSREAKVAIWGCGFVGTTNLFYLSKQGFTCLGIDTSERRVHEINNGYFNINSDMEAIDVSEKKFEVVQDFHSYDLSDIDIHMLCLPTEKDFKPYNGFIVNVINSIIESKSRGFLLIIECSMPPRWIDECIIRPLEKKSLVEGKDYILGSAPRRDLFGDEKFSLKNTQRVISGDNEGCKKIMYEFYNSFCDKLVIGKDNYHTVLSKIVENTYRCFDISLANQLNVALKDFDINHVLELAATKWNMQKYHPSFGIGGYCIPLAPQYIMEQINNDYSILPVFKQMIDFNENSIDKVLSLYLPLINKSDNIAVLGLSSIPNVGILNCSIGLQLVKKLYNLGYRVNVDDPYFTSEELTKVSSCDSIPNIYDMTNYHVIFIVTQHDKYKNLFSKIKFCKDSIVIDSFNTWENMGKDMKHLEVGQAVMEE